MAERDETPADAPGTVSRGLGAWTGILVFGFGTAAGFLVAFSGLAFLEDGAGLIVLVFLSALFVVTLLGAMLFLARKPSLRRVFGHAETKATEAEIAKD